MMSGGISFPICTSPLFSPRPFIHPFQLNCPRKGFFISLLRWADELKPVIEVSAFSSITGYFFLLFYGYQSDCIMEYICVSYSAFTRFWNKIVIRDNI